MQLSDNARGAVLMNVAMAAFTLNDAVMREVLSNAPLFQSMALRGVVATFLLLVLAWRMGALRAWPGGRDGHFILLRAAFDVAATLTFLVALPRLPLANLSAILQATPLGVTLAAALFLGESVGWRRSLAIVAGFCGVLLIVRPGPDGFSIWAILGLVSVLFVVLRDMVTRGISRAAPSSLVALVTAAAVSLTGFAGSVAEGWAPVPPGEAALLVLAGCLVILGYLSVVAAMRVGEVGAVAPFRYMALVWAMLLGWLVFGDLPDGLTLLGSAVVVASGLYTLLREARLRRRAAIAAG